MWPTGTLFLGGQTCRVLIPMLFLCMAKAQPADFSGCRRPLRLATDKLEVDYELGRVLATNEPAVRFTVVSLPPAQLDGTGVYYGAIGLRGPEDREKEYSQMDGLDGVAWGSDVSRVVDVVGGVPPAKSDQKTVLEEYRATSTSIKVKFWRPLAQGTRVNIVWAVGVGSPVTGTWQRHQHNGKVDVLLPPCPLTEGFFTHGGFDASLKVLTDPSDAVHNYLAGSWDTVCYAGLPCKTLVFAPRFVNTMAVLHEMDPSAEVQVLAEVEAPLEVVSGAGPVKMHKSATGDQLWEGYAALPSLVLKRQGFEEVGVLRVVAMVKLNGTLLPASTDPLTRSVRLPDVVPPVEQRVVCVLRGAEFDTFSKKWFTDSVASFVQIPSGATLRVASVESSVVPLQRVVKGSTSASGPCLARASVPVRVTWLITGVDPDSAANVYQHFLNDVVGPLWGSGTLDEELCGVEESYRVFASPSLVLEPGSHAFPSLPAGGYSNLQTDLWTGLCMSGRECQTMALRIAVPSTVPVDAECVVRVGGTDAAHLWKLRNAKALMTQNATCFFTQLIIIGRSGEVPLEFAVEGSGYTGPKLHRTVDVTAASAQATAVVSTTLAVTPDAFAEKDFNAEVGPVLGDGEILDVQAVELNTAIVGQSNTIANCKPTDSLLPPPAVGVRVLWQPSNPDDVQKAVANLVYSHSTLSRELCGAIVTTVAWQTYIQSEDLRLRFCGDPGYSYDYLREPIWETVCHNGLACKVILLCFTASETPSVLREVKSEANATVSVQSNNTSFVVHGGTSVFVPGMGNLGQWFSLHRLSITGPAPAVVTLRFTAAVGNVVGPALEQQVWIRTVEPREDGQQARRAVRVLLRVPFPVFEPQAQKEFPETLRQMLAVGTAANPTVVRQAPRSLRPVVSPLSSRLASTLQLTCGGSSLSEGTEVTWMLLPNPDAAEPALSPAEEFYIYDAFLAAALDPLSPMGEGLCGIDEVTGVWAFIASSPPSDDDGGGGSTAGLAVVCVVLVLCCCCVTVLLVRLHQRERAKRAERAGSGDAEVQNEMHIHPAPALQPSNPVPAMYHYGPGAVHGQPGETEDEIQKLQREIENLEKQRVAIDKALSRPVTSTSAGNEVGHVGATAAQLKPFAPPRVPLDVSPAPPPSDPSPGPPPDRVEIPEVVKPEEEEPKPEPGDVRKSST